MSFWDILREAPPTPLGERYLAAGATLAIATNSECILEGARETFEPTAEPNVPAQVSMRLWVDSAARASPPWPAPYFRGLDHLVFAAFDFDNALLVDLRNRRVVGRFSPAMAADRAYWKRVIFPAVFGIVSPSVGVTALHCACVARNGSALLLAGASGSGKSTLSLALARSGFSFLSDDWTYFSRRDGQLLAWNSVSNLKLLPDAVDHFPELAALELGVSVNGELAYEVDPVKVFGVRRSEHAEPRWLVFLERQENTEFTLIELASAEAATSLEQDLEGLPAVLSNARLFFEETVEDLAAQRCWLLRYGGNPHAIAQALSRFCESVEAE
jgi:energy-coupling factor transporter ATP-binding protein EcfA2